MSQSPMLPLMRLLIGAKAGTATAVFDCSCYCHDGCCQNLLSMLMVQGTHSWNLLNNAAARTRHTKIQTYTMNGQSAVMLGLQSRLTVQSCLPYSSAPSVGTTELM